MSNKTLLSEDISRGTKYLAIGLALVFVLSGSLFLRTLSISSQNGYRISQEETVRNKLNQENHDLQLKLLKATALNELEEETVFKQMIPARNIEFFETRYERLSRLDPELSPEM